MGGDGGCLFRGIVPRSPPKEEKPRIVDTEKGRNERKNGEARESTTKSQQFAMISEEARSQWRRRGDFWRSARRHATILFLAL